MSILSEETDAIKICLAGVTGRMGKAIIEEAKRYDDVSVVSGVAAHIPKSDQGLPVFRPDEIPEACKNADVWMDFTTPDAFLANLSSILEQNVAIVVGTTGWYDKQTDVNHQIMKAKIPALFSPNFSPLVNLQFYLTKLSCKTLANYGYDFGIVEEHHESKIDVPSGTADKLADIIIETIGKGQKRMRTRGREKKMPYELDMASLRLKGTVGDHELRIRSENARMNIDTMIYNRKEFARGALYATKWLFKNGKGGGIFFFDRDVLGLE